MNELTLKLTLDEINLVLNALGEQPFARVYQLVSKLQTQVNDQAQQNETDPIKEKEREPILTDGGSNQS